MAIKKFSKEYRDALRSLHFRQVCRAVFKRANGICERCHKRPATDPHHKHYNTLGRERPEDLLAVCRPCHDILTREMEDEREERYQNARVEGWATKKYGPDWTSYHDPIEVEQEFEVWLERRGEY